MTELLDYISRVSIFSHLSTDHLARLCKSAHYHNFSPGDEIIREGEHDGRLFVIVKGSVDVVKNRGQRSERRLATLGPFDYFGEMALIDDLARSATVMAREETELLSIDQLDLHKEIQTTPSMAIALLKMLSQRVRTIQTSLTNNLGGLLPICCSCKNIRNEDGTWVRIEDYVSQHSDADFTHGVCPDCLIKLYPQHFGKKERV